MTGARYGVEDVITRLMGFRREYVALKFFEVWNAAEFIQSFLRITNA